MPLNPKGLPVFHREPEKPTHRSTDPDQMVRLQERVQTLEQEVLRYRDVDRECTDLHEYSQLLEEELEESKKKVLAQAVTIQRIEEERQQSERETEQLRLRLASVTEEVEKKDGLMGQMRSAASIVEDGVAEMRSRYDEILKRMADEIITSQTEVQRLKAAKRGGARTLSDGSLGPASPHSPAAFPPEPFSPSQPPLDTTLDVDSVEPGVRSDDDDDEEEEEGRRTGGVRVQSCLISQQSVRLLLAAVQRGRWFARRSYLERSWRLREGMMAFRKALRDVRAKHSALSPGLSEEEGQRQEESEDVDSDQESSTSRASDLRWPSSMSRRSGGSEGASREGRVGRDIRRLMTARAERAADRQ